MRTWQARIGAMMVAAAAALGFGGTASAQDYSFGWNPRSGGSLKPGQTLTVYLP